MINQPLLKKANEKVKKIKKTEYPKGVEEVFFPSKFSFLDSFSKWKSLYQSVPKPLEKKTVENILKKGADFFESRRAEYGEEYLKTGKIRKAFFLDGIKLETEDDFYYFHIFDTICTKLSRIAEHWEKGQHNDSWNDIMIYASMSLERIKNGE